TQMVRTLSFGNPSKESEGAYTACLAALETAETFLKPGYSTIEVFKAIHDTIEQAGYQMGLHPGHSQGLDIFERPLIDGKDDVTLKEGMIIILHPHVLIPSGGGVWVGETFVITPEGYHRLNKCDRDLQVL
ncbi:M24 family metallopeptidase, partial [Chloroflexota bacterium]